jgi:hypothetical protein
VVASVVPPVAGDPLYEGELQPFERAKTKDGHRIKTKEMHVHELPWPKALLQDLGETPVTMRVTLSYFIQPSPGRMGWGQKFRFQSHGLRFASTPQASLSAQNRPPSARMTGWRTTRRRNEYTKIWFHPKIRSQEYHHVATVASSGPSLFHRVRDSSVR